MKVSRPTCRYCGTIRRNRDDVNMQKSYCMSCSKVRMSLAGKAFADRQIEMVKGGKYILSIRK